MSIKCMSFFRLKKIFMKRSTHFPVEFVGHPLIDAIHNRQKTDVNQLLENGKQFRRSTCNCAFTQEVENRKSRKAIACNVSRCE